MGDQIYRTWKSSTPDDIKYSATFDNKFSERELDILNGNAAIFGNHMDINFAVRLAKNIMEGNFSENNDTKITEKELGSGNEKIVNDKPLNEHVEILKLGDGFEGKKELLNDDVKKLQKSLKDLGYEIDVDGDFGEKTKAALEEFQTKNGLKVDGIFGPDTNKIMNQKLDELNNKFSAIDLGDIGSSLKASGVAQSSDSISSPVYAVSNNKEEQISFA